MKKIEAIIRHMKLDEVKSTLDDLGIHGMTVHEVKGYGKQRGYTETWRGTTVTIQLRPKVKIELVVRDNVAAQVVDAIAKTAHTGEIGDGKIFVSTIDEAIAIRTGTKGTDAL